MNQRWAWAGVSRAAVASPLQPEEREPLAAVDVEVARGGGEHEPDESLAVAAPQELGDRPAHRVAEGDEPVEPDRVGHRDHVVGAILEPERGPRPDPRPVAPVIEGEHAEVLAQRSVGAEEVEVGGGRPPVQEHQSRCAGRAGQLAQHDRAGGQLDPPAGRQAGRIDGRDRLDRLVGPAQAASTWSTRTRSSPVGASNDTVSPARCPIRAAPNGAVGLITSRSPERSSMWPTR